MELPNFLFLVRAKGRETYMCTWEKYFYIHRLSFKVVRTKYERPPDTCTQLFIAPLYTMAKGGNNSNVHQQMMDKQDVAHTKQGMFLSPEKE